MEGGAEATPPSSVVHFSPDLFSIRLMKKKKVRQGVCRYIIYLRNFKYGAGQEAWMARHGCPSVSFRRWTEFQVPVSCTVSLSMLNTSVIYGSLGVCESRSRGSWLRSGSGTPSCPSTVERQKTRERGESRV